MSRRQIRLFVSVAIFLSFAFYQISVSYFSQPKSTEVPDNVLGQRDENFTVSKVIDGDTIEVNIDGNKEKVRIIGINTPETVDPRREVECFGKEASSKAKELLLGQKVRLESDPSQAEQDEYDRLLRYVFLSGGKDFGKIMIQQGYAYEYTYDLPYKYQKEYKEAQQQAQTSNIGLWRDGLCGK